MVVKTPKDYGLVSSNVEIDAWGHIEVDSSFDLKAEDFLSFAEEDIKGNKHKDIINALSNAKRAIENRMDLLLYAFGYPILEERWFFPKKLDMLKDLGIIAPRILGKINTIRNLLEHEYKIPNKAGVEDAIDVAILFLESTKNFIHNFVDDFNCYDKHNHVSIGFIKHTELKISIVSWKEKGSPIAENKFTVTYKDSTFRDWLRFLIENAY